MFGVYAPRGRGESSDDLRYPWVVLGCCLRSVDHWVESWANFKLTIPTIHLNSSKFTFQGPSFHDENNPHGMTFISVTLHDIVDSHKFNETMHSNSFKFLHHEPFHDFHEVGRYAPTSASKLLCICFVAQGTLALPESESISNVYRYDSVYI